MALSEKERTLIMMDTFDERLRATLAQIIAFSGTDDAAESYEQLQTLKRSMEQTLYHLSVAMKLLWV